MAARQHILPRFLLKGFASRTNKNEVYAWVFQKGGKCYETNIINIAVEKYFYGEDGEGTVDDKITDFEGKFAPLLNDLRSLDSMEKINLEGIDEFICHLEVRTKHLRDSFRIPGEFMADDLEKRFSNIDNIKEALSDDPRFSNFLPHLPKELEDVFVKASKTFFHAVKEATPQMVKNGHIEAMSKEVVPESRVQRYRQLDWYVCNTDKKLILGDVGTVLEVAGKKKFISYFFKVDTIKNVFLPISTTQMLVGTSLPQVPEIDSSKLNLKAARLSREFFVSPEKTHDIYDLAGQIGIEAEIISQREIAKIVDKKYKT